MGASKKIRRVLFEKELTQVELAKLAGKDVQALRNQLYRDNFTYASVEHLCDALGVEIVFRDKESGKLYD